MITIEIPFQIKHNGVRTLITTSKDETNTAQHAAKCAKPKCVPNKILLRALTRAWYWQKLLDEGKYRSIKAMSRKLNMNVGEMGRIMRLNLLAPDIQRAILDGTQPRTMNLEMLKKPFSLVWSEQRAHFGFDAQ